MDVTISIQNNTIYMTQCGDYDADAYLRAVAEIVGMPDFAVGMPVIVDARGLTTPASTEQLAALRCGLETQELRAFRPTRYATVTRVVAGHLQVKLIATMVAMRLIDPPENFVMRQFPTVAAAEAWIRQTGE
jgi:hypothetical protein